MRTPVIVTTTSLLSIVLFALHWVDEIARGMERGTLVGLGGIAILTVWSYATLALAERRSGYIISLLGGIFGLGVLIMHMKGIGLVGGKIPANSSGVFFWVGTLIMLGVTSALSFLFSVRGLWGLRKTPKQP
jgi:hypothetical protein